MKINKSNDQQLAYLYSRMDSKTLLETISRGNMNVKEATAIAHEAEWRFPTPV